MAHIKVDSAFVEDVVTDRDGVPFALRTSEPHRRKNDAGEWETTARTFRTVKASRESGIGFTNYVKGDRVTFEGTEKTEGRDYQGSKRWELVVWVTALQAIGGGGAATSYSPIPEPDFTPAGGGWDDNDSTPF